MPCRLENAVLADYPGIVDKARQRLQNGVKSIPSRIEEDELTRPETNGLARQAANGAAALFVRQGLIYSCNIVGGILLAKLLTPVEFGFYGIVLFFLAFLNIFGGTGFAANLIRTEEHPSLADFRAVFTGQQIVVALIFAGICFVAQWLASHYHMQNHGSAFFRLIGLALMLTSLMVVPQVLMERELQAFGKLAIVEVAQALISLTSSLKMSSEPRVARGRSSLAAIALAATRRVRRATVKYDRTLGHGLALGCKTR